MDEEAVKRRNEILAKAREKAAEVRKKKLEEKMAQQAIQQQIKEQLADKQIKEALADKQIKETQPIEIPKAKEIQPCWKEELENMEEEKKIINSDKKKKKKIIVYADSSDSEEEQIIIKQKKNKPKPEPVKTVEDPTTQHLETELLKRQYALKLQTLREEHLRNFLCPPSNWKR